MFTGVDHIERSRVRLGKQHTACLQIERGGRRSLQPAHMG